MQDPRSPAALGARRSLRVKVAWRAQITFDRHIHEARAVDLSEEGVGLLCDTTFPRGEVVGVVLGVPSLVDRLRIQPTGFRVQVMFTRFAASDCRIGGQFIDLSDAVRTLLRWHVSQGVPA